MLHTLIAIFKDNWIWRKQIVRLAVFELIKQSRGAVLSWAWLFIKPAVYIFVFWFALDIGLKAGGTNSYPPYFLWLISGIIPWFYMRDIVNTGSDVLHRFPYLVNKMKFPLSGISTIFSLSTLVVHIGLMIVLFVIYFCYGLPIDIYLLQIPFIIIIMFVYFNMFSIITSQISAISKDFANLLKALVTPLFWLSGIIYNIENVHIKVIRDILLINPVTFFVSSFRDALLNRTWIWNNTESLGAFAIIFLITLVLMLIVYKRFHEEVHDAL